MLVIFLTVAVFYGFIPVLGAVFRRVQWVFFRRHFDELRLHPILNYREYRQLKETQVFRFTGEVESITDGQTLWVKGENLSISVSLKNVQCRLLPKNEGKGEILEPLEKIRWSRVSTLTEGARVFVGGVMEPNAGKPNFISTNKRPLIVIFYNCPDTELVGKIIRSARTRNEYRNSLAYVSIAVGALVLFYIALSFLNRPAFRLTVITSLIAVFTPVLPMFPPGILLTIIYRRMSRIARESRAYWDIVRLPLRYLKHTRSRIQENKLLDNTKELYGFIKTNTLQSAAESGNIPFMLPEISGTKNQDWYFFGVIDKKSFLPVRSKDPFVSFGILPAPPEKLARRYAIKAYALEAAAWLVLLSGIFINIIFIYNVLFLLRGITF